MGSDDYLVNPATAQADPALAAALGRACQRRPFDRLEWWAALAEECLLGESPLIAIIRGGSAVCALPLLRRGNSGQLRSLANWYSFRAGPVFTGGGERLLPLLARSLARDAARISLAPLDPGLAALVGRDFAAAGWAVEARAGNVSHRLLLAGRSFAEYWQSRPGRLRETVRRKQAKGVVALHIHDRFDPDAWAAYEAVYAKSWKPSEGSPAFLRRFAEAEGAAGNLRLGLGTIAGQPVAAQLWTVEAGTAWIHKLAYDEAAKPHSPGTLLSAALFEHAIDRERVHTIDFGTGDDAYKRDWMELAEPLLRLDMHRPLRPSSWPHLLRARLRGPGFPLAAPQHGR